MKDRIMKTARELFRKRGLRDVNIEEICHTLGISKKTFYVHYESKESLVGSIVDSDFEKFQKQFHKVFSERDPIDATIWLLDFYRRNFTSLDRRIREDIVRCYPEVFRSHAGKRVDMIHGELREMYMRGVESGIFRSDFDYDVIAVEMFLFQRSIMSFLNGETESPVRRLPAKALVSGFLDIIKIVFLTPEGSRLCTERMRERETGRDKTKNTNNSR